MALTMVSPSVIPSIEPDEPGPAIPRKVIRTAIVLQKSTKWDWEKKQNPRKTETELLQLLRSRGENIERIRANDAKQKEAVREIVSRLEQNGISVRVATRNELGSYLSWADLLLSAGGDGTFLAAAAAVPNNRTPVIGINTDPIGSEGHLCIGGKQPPNDLIERIVMGNIKNTERSRIRVTLLNRKHEAKNKCILALNEVFVGEDEAAKVSTYEISINDAPMVKQKSSGLIVSTGSGSTSWYLGMNRVEDQNVTQILETMLSMGVEVKGNIKELSAEVAKRINDKIPFEVDHPNFAFSIREPIFNATFKKTPVRGYARKIHLRSKCSKGYLVLDGATKIPFNSGAEVLLEIRPEDNLKTFSL